MRCAGCKWWTRFTRPEWADKQPARWADILFVDPKTLETGECDRPYGTGYATSLIRIELNYALYTHETFGCVQFESAPTLARDAPALSASCHIPAPADPPERVQSKPT